MTLMITSSGNFFGELLPTFGGVASAGIYNKGARVVLELAILKSGIPRSKITQVLDNVVVCRALVKAAYRDICKTIGVSLVGWLRHYVLKVSPLAKTQMTW